MHWSLHQIRIYLLTLKYAGKTVFILAAYYRSADFFQYGATLQRRNILQHVLVKMVGLLLSSNLGLEYSFEYLIEYSSTRQFRKLITAVA